MKLLKIILFYALLLVPLFTESIDLGQRFIFLLGIEFILLLVMTWDAARRQVAVSWNIVVPGLFCGYLLLHQMWSPVPFQSLHETVFVEFLFFVYISAGILKSEPSFRAGAIRIIAWSAIGVAFITLLQQVHLLKGVPGVWNGTPGFVKLMVPGRASGIFLNPNHLAGFCAFALPLILFRYFSQTPIRTIRVALLSAVLVSAISASGSRGGTVAAWMGILMTCMILIIQRRPIRRLLFLAGFLAVVQVATLYGNGGIIHRVKASIDQTHWQAQNINQGDNQRLAGWKGSYQLWKAEPLFGIGVNMINSLWPSVQAANDQSFPSKAHNIFLQLLCETGILGLGLAVTFLGFIATQCIRNRARLDPIHMAAGISILVILCHDQFDFSFYSPIHSVAIATMLALTLPARDKSREMPPALLAGLCSVAVLAFGIYGYHLQGFLWEESQARTATSPKEWYQHLERAHHWEPQAPHVILALASAVLNNTLAQKEQGEAANFAACRSLYSRALRVDPYSLSARFGWAMAHLDSNPKDAFALVKTTTTWAPNSYIAANLAAKFYRLAGDKTEEQHWTKRAQHLEVFLSGYQQTSRISPAARP